MQAKFQAAVGNLIASVAQFYHESRVRAENLRSVKYRIVTTLTDYKKSKQIELALTDRPGDILPPMSIQQIKEKKDIIAHMHPIDVNSINDLYYLSKDKVIEVRASEDTVVAKTQEGLTVEYNINHQLDLNNIISTRVSYMLGHMQAEKLIREAYKENNRYKIIRDNIATLYISDNKTNEELVKKPIDILFSGEYKLYSKEDVARIGYICGQMSDVN